MIQIYSDGASNCNPGMSRAGICIKSAIENQDYSLPLGELTNHEADLLATQAIHLNT